MFGIKLCFVLTILSVLDLAHLLISLPRVEDNNIIKAEAIIRSTVNTLFATLGLRKVSDKTKIKHFAVVHNYFVSLTLQDYNSLKEIAKLTRVNRSNVTTSINNINLINDILREDIDLIAPRKDELKYDIEGEIEKLDNLKKYYAQQDINSVRLNNEILKILEKDETDGFRNKTEKGNGVNGENDKILDELATWHDDESTVSGRRIFKGRYAKIKKYPFMASVNIFNKFQCGGCIIKTDLILTAASCLQLAWNNRFYRENPLFLSVRVGSSTYDFGGENIEVLEVYFHPGYSPLDLQNNLAVMRLLRRISLGKRAKKINLDTNESGLPLNVANILIIGWGANGQNNVLRQPFQDRLRYATLPVYGLKDCKDIYSSKYVTEKHFCAGTISVGSGACNRDVGGPGIVSGRLVGIISFGAPVCGTPDAPTVFTKVGFYFDWIETIMDQTPINVRQRLTRSPVRFLYTSPRKTLKTTTSSEFGFKPLERVATINDKEKVTTNTSTYPKSNLKYVDKTLFKEFLKTMFDSDEIKDYLDVMKNEPKFTMEKAGTTNIYKDAAVRIDLNQNKDLNSFIDLLPTPEYQDNALMELAPMLTEKSIADNINYKENMMLSQLPKPKYQGGVVMEQKSILTEKSITDDINYKENTMLSSVVDEHAMFTSEEITQVTNNPLTTDIFDNLSGLLKNFDTSPANPQQNPSEIEINPPEFGNDTKYYEENTGKVNNETLRTVWSDDISLRSNVLEEPNSTEEFDDVDNEKGGMDIETSSNATNNNVDDDILTLLYLSDKEADNVHNLKDFDSFHTTSEIRRQVTISSSESAAYLNLTNAGQTDEVKSKLNSILEILKEEIVKSLKNESDKLNT